MGFKEGHGLGKNLQGRALPIQVVKREGKGAVGRYGNEDPNRVKPTAGNSYFSISNFILSFCFLKNLNSVKNHENRKKMLVLLLHNGENNHEK
jgi:hypothetical protein